MKWALVVAAAMLAAACSPSLLKLPTGPGVTVGATEAAAALAQATMACASVGTMTAEIGVSGSANGHRLRGRLSAGVARPASARLEAVAPFGQPLFIFVAVQDDATLLLPRDGRVLEHGRADAVLDAVAGIPLGAADLQAMLTGCTPAAGAERSPLGAKQFGNAWLVLGGPDEDEIYLHRETPADAWGLTVIVRQASVLSVRWRAEFGGGRLNAIPRSIRLTSLDTGGRTGQAFDLRLALSQIDVNMPLGREVFTIDVPGSAMRMTLEDVRAAGVVGAR